MKTLTLYITLALTLCACTKKDYTNNIPQDAAALIRLNAMEFSSEKSPFASIVMPFVDKDRKSMKGIDLTKDVYFFEEKNGTHGFCASLSDATDFADFMQRMKTIGVADNFSDNNEKQFCIITNTWIMGFDRDAVLVMGPANTKSSQDSLIQHMMILMEQEEENSIKTSTLWQHLEEKLQSPMRFVSQADVLPKHFAHTLATSIPGHVNLADVLIEAEMEYRDSTLFLYGSTSSANDSIKALLDKADDIYKPLSFNWNRLITDTTLVGVFMNVNGQEITPLLKSNKALNTMLAGTDGYERICGNNGNIAILLTPKEGDSFETSFSTHVRNLPTGNKPRHERMVIVLNMKSVANRDWMEFLPVPSKIQRVVYTLKD